MALNRSQMLRRFDVAVGSKAAMYLPSAMGQVIPNERTFWLDFRDFRPGLGRCIPLTAPGHRVNPTETCPSVWRRVCRMVVPAGSSRCYLVAAIVAAVWSARALIWTIASA